MGGMEWRGWGQSLGPVKGRELDHQTSCIKVGSTKSYIIKNTSSKTEKWKLLSRVRLFVTPLNSPGQNTGVGPLSLLQGIFPTWGLNPYLPHCRWILYQLSHKRRGRQQINLLAQPGIWVDMKVSFENLWLQPDLLVSLGHISCNIWNRDS